MTMKKLLIWLIALKPRGGTPWGLKQIFLSFTLVGTLITAQTTVKPKTSEPKTSEPKTSEPKTSDGESNKEKSGATEKADEKEVNYLDLIHARERALKWKDENMRDIQRLNSIVHLFPEAVNKSEYDTVATSHKDAMKLVYRREYVPAEKLLRENREAIAKLFAHAAGVYRKKTSEMLNQSADRMADFDMQAEHSGSADSIRMSGVVQKNQHRLNIAYQQLTQAVSAERNRRYAEALALYKLARLHAIHLMVELAKDEAEKKKIRNDFRNELDERSAPKSDKTAESKSGQ